MNIDKTNCNTINASIRIVRRCANTVFKEVSPLNMSGNY